MTMKQNTSAKAVLMDTLEQLLRKKAFQKISVNELCEASFVSRTAFYANFKDKYHLLSCCLESKTEEINALIDTHSPKEFFSVTLDFIQKENRLFYNAFSAELEPEILDILYTFFERHFISLLNEKVSEGLVLPGPVEVVSSFYVGGLSFSTLRWVRSNYEIPKEELAACQCSLLRDIL